MSKLLRQAAANVDESPDLECWVPHANTCQVQGPIPENRVCSTVLVLVIAECPRGPQPRSKLGGSILCLRHTTRDIQDRVLDPRLVTYGSSFPGREESEEKEEEETTRRPLSLSETECLCVSFRAGTGSTKGLELRTVQHAQRAGARDPPTS